MDAAALYQSGQLQAAIDAQIQVVKGAPADQAKRLFLFELAAFAGDLERSRKQLDAISYESVELQAALSTYRQLLDSEVKRRRWFSEGLAPQYLMDPPNHVQKRVEAVNRIREGNLAEARTLLDEANDELGLISGVLNEKPFAEIRDADDLFGTVLEVFARGEYFWVPLEQVELIAINPPRFPRDLLWIPARLETIDASGEVFLPSLYPNSHVHADDQVKLGRMTDWSESDEGPILGQGLRMFLVGDETPSILDWRELRIGAAV
ncbi:MAG: type VI secretion system accessory protein TagJ [Planctomycetota bacterium]|nr:type VI secretion system accessory protein TagJ [Planctomycetota bacterium]